MAFMMPVSELVTDNGPGPTGDTGGGASGSTSSDSKLDWVHQFGSIGNDECYQVSHRFGDVYVAGTVAGALAGQQNLGGTDGYLIKYDMFGNEQWTVQFGTIADDRVFGVYVCSYGVYVCGATTGTFPNNRPNAGTDDAFISQFDHFGRPQWTKQFGTGQWDYVYKVYADASGVYGAGITGGPLFSGYLGNFDAFVVKLSHTGAISWADQYGTTGRDLSGGIYGFDKEIYVCGITSGALPGQAHAGSDDCYVRKYTFDGTLIWTRQFGTPGVDRCESVYTMASLNYVVGGTYGTLAGLGQNQGGMDVFIGKFTANGIFTFKTFGTPANDYAYGVSWNHNGVNIAGETSGTFPDQSSAGATDAFVCSLDYFTLADNWMLQFGTAGSDYVTGIASDAHGIYLSGETSGTLPGETPLGGTDGFVAKVVEGPKVRVSPDPIEFEETEVWETSTLTVKIMNYGMTYLVVNEIHLASGGTGYFEIESLPEFPVSIRLGYPLSIDIKYHPWETGDHSDTLVILSNDPNNDPAEVTIQGSAKETEKPPEEQIDDTEDFIDDSLDDGTLEPVGPGNSGEGKIDDIKEMLAKAQAYIDEGDTENAIGTLKALLKKCDGKPKPPDKVTGEAAEELAARIQSMIDELESG
jgi:hypothetical protein